MPRRFIIDNIPDDSWADVVNGLAESPTAAIDLPPSEQEELVKDYIIRHLAGKGRDYAVRNAMAAVRAQMAEQQQQALANIESVAAQRVEETLAAITVIVEEIVT